MQILEQELAVRPDLGSMNATNMQIQNYQKEV